MEELLQLKNCLLARNYEEAILIVEELETMSRQDKINTLESYLTVLLIHLIKIQVEKRVTKSWLVSLRNSIYEIKRRNRLGKKSHYIKQGEWLEHFNEVISEAIVDASQEVFGGINPPKLRIKIDFPLLQAQTLELLDLTYSDKNSEEIKEYLEQKFVN
ncbi:MAG: DUF29 family protein [Xenococcaceae cyanobacterium MO_167.B27]|nr:DUF29 family protein [Xenococcaceae cyanobacterium MO_167.B27]